MGETSVTKHLSRSRDTKLEDGGLGGFHDKKKARSDLPSTEKNALVKPRNSLRQRLSMRIRKFKMIDTPKSRLQHPEASRNAAQTADNSSDQVKDLEGAVKLVMSGDPAQQLMGVRKIRQLLSVASNPPIQRVIDTGVVPKLVQLLSQDNEYNQKLQFEAAWALTNICSGSSVQCREVVDAGVLDPTLRLLMSPDDDVMTQAIWLLGNISGDSTQYRDLCLRCNAMQGLLACLTPDSPIMVLRNGVWAVSNLCRGAPKPPFRSVEPAIPVLASLLQLDDEDVLTDACWAISYISDGREENIDGVIGSGVLPRVIQLLSHSSTAIVTPALRAAGNLVTGSDQTTQAVIDAGFVTRLHAFLDSDRNTIRKEALWAISNIAAGTKDQIQELLGVDGLMTKVFELLKTDRVENQSECTWIIGNITEGGTKEQIRAIVDLGAVEALIVGVSEVMGSPSSRSAGRVGFDAMKNILTHCPDTKQKFIDGGIVALLEEARANDAVNQHASIDALDNLLGDVSENDNENENETEN